MLHDAVELVDAGPISIRYARGAARQVDEHDVGSGLAARRVAEGADVCILAVGTMLETAERAAEELADAGTNATVWDVRCCAPLDPKMVEDAARHPLVVTIEDGVRAGGIGMFIADHVRTLDPAIAVEVLGLPTKFLPHDPKPNALHARYGLDVAGIVAAVRRH